MPCQRCCNRSPTGGIQANERNGTEPRPNGVLRTTVLGVTTPLAAPPRSPCKAAARERTPQSPRARGGLASPPPPAFFLVRPFARHASRGHPPENPCPYAAAQRLLQGMACPTPAPQPPSPPRPAARSGWHHARRARRFETLPPPPPLLFIPTQPHLPSPHSTPTRAAPQPFALPPPPPPDSLSAQWQLGELPSSRPFSSPRCSRWRSRAVWPSGAGMCGRMRTGWGSGAVTPSRTRSRTGTRRSGAARGPRPTPPSTAAATRPAPWVRPL